jgi:hypothetical protein
VLIPIWKDPVCGDGNCEWPWEFPAWGTFGCRADCGLNDNTTNIVLNVRADFSGHPSISPRVLMSNAVWNLCLKDEARSKRGEVDLCWYGTDQAFEQPQSNQILSMKVIDGAWYVIVKGDYAGRVGGRIYDASNSSGPTQIATEPEWKSCTINRKIARSSSTLALRRLLQAYTHAHRLGGEDGRRVLVEAVDKVRAMPELKHIDFAQFERVSMEAAREAGLLEQEREEEAEVVKGNSTVASDSSASASAAAAGAKFAVHSDSVMPHAEDPAKFFF